MSCIITIAVGIIEAKDQSHSVNAGIQQALEYGRILDIPCVFSSNGNGFLFHDRTAFGSYIEKELLLEQFPSPETLWQKYKQYKNLVTPEQDAIAQQEYYSDGSGRKPRYYQQIAINRTVEAIAKGQNRILLVMATGTGKIYAAFQIIYRLWKACVKKRILFLADRNALIDQTKRGDFKHFRDKMTVVKKRQIDKSYEVYLALYQDLSGNDEAANAYKQFSPDFFDLIVIDECHRGSAAADSAWREILRYFNKATHIGLTATPKETKDISNIEYFGDPIYTYSLKQGIDDGFLAPYKVIRVTLNIDPEGWRPEKDKTDKKGNIVEGRIYNRKDFDRNIEIDERTELVSKKVTEFLIGFDCFAKTIIFCVDIDHAERMRSAIARQNADNKAHFIIKEDDEGLIIQPKPAFGKLFSSTGNDLTGLNNLLLKGIPPAALFKKPENTDVVHGYALIYPGRKFHLPLVLPFIGKLNKAGNAIKSFIDFARTEAGMAELQLTPEQAVLHKKCFRMFKLAEQLPYKIFTDVNDLPGYIEWFQLLKQAWLLLLKQSFVYGYYSYRIKLLKKRMLKQYTGNCQMHAEPVQLSFVLTIKADYYTLKPVFSANGKVLDNKSYEQYSALIMHNNAGDFYLLNSLIDIAALEYIDNFTQGLTIFKPYFDEFSNGLLKALFERYPMRCLFPAREQLHYETVALKPVKKILVIHEHQTVLLLFPFFEYDYGKRVNPLQNGTIYLLEKNGSYVLQKRDKIYETAFVQQLLALKEDFASQLNEDCLYIAKWKEMRLPHG